MSAPELVKFLMLAAILVAAARAAARGGQPSAPRPAGSASLDDLIDHAQRTVTENYPTAEWAALTISLPGRPKVVLDVSPPASASPARPVPDVF